jgi:hypothetical protein
MAVTNATRWNLLSGGMLSGSIHPFARSQAVSRAGQGALQAASQVPFRTIGFPDMLGKTYNEPQVAIYVCL